MSIFPETLKQEIQEVMVLYDLSIKEMLSKLLMLVMAWRKEEEN